ncbi:hypothetical protein HHE02_10920 [Helicobacter heilmannii]|uniref:hypothetical protein n=1 Tax=Helicobacter heilmannii TaxID=35817 RepID=UPI0006A14CBB|nr:hypothetical protein [Helicobacter heilmannii]CRF47797.1 hypothetical protein HHE02_10920 [Helicobacter heilmannii]
MEDQEDELQPGAARGAREKGGNGERGAASGESGKSGKSGEGSGESGEGSASAEEQELEALKQELAQVEASLETDFAQYAAEHMEEFEQDFWDDRVGFVNKLLQLQNKFLQERLGDKIQRAQELQTTIAGQSTTKELQAGQEAFLQEHPDANVQAMGEFYTDDLPPKYRKQLDTLSGKEFWSALYELYNAYTGASGGQEEEAGLPKRLEGNAGQASGGGQEMVMNRF